MTENKLGRVGVIARFKPLHNGAYAMLEAVCENANEVIIGIGSANKYSLRNPFTAKESEDMVRLTLEQKFSNYSIIHIPDFAQIPEYSDGKKWKEYVIEKFGKLDYFISSNPYVTDLLKDTYNVIQPYTIINSDKKIMMRGTLVRLEMARGNNWENLVPKEVAKYLKKNNLVERFRKEFGLQTLAELVNDTGINTTEDFGREKIHPMEN